MFLFKIALLLLLLVSIIYIHFRGRVKLRPLRQLTDHSTILAPYNLFVYLFSAVPRTPYLDASFFPELKLLRDNWQTIRDEALQLSEEGVIKAADKKNDLAFNSFFKKGWKRFYLNWYGDYFPSASSRCPKTISLLKQIPSIRAALFTQLSPGSVLGKHRDPFAGSVRYHLGLSTPNSPECSILVDGQTYYWKDGEDVLFDETYIHEAYNRTDQNRIILFCDVQRPLKFAPFRWLNGWFTNFMGRITTTENMEGDQVGALNRLYAGFNAFQQLGKKLKAKNKYLYYCLKYAAMLGILYWFLSF